MLSPESARELQTAWFPNMTDAGLDRIIELLEKGSPLLIHGSFTRAIPMGCLATHAGWNHPKTEHLTMDAGICWLTHVAGLNPATSQVLREWDRSCSFNHELRDDLLQNFRQEREKRNTPVGAPASRLKPEPALVD